MPDDNVFELLKIKCGLPLAQESGGAILIPKESLLAVAAALRHSDLSFEILHCLTAVDKKEHLELVYIFQSRSRRNRLTLKINLPWGDLAAESLCGLWKAADWFEREVYDLFGVRFLNHPDPRRLLNPDDWQGHPLRKDYSHPGLIPKPKF